MKIGSKEWSELIIEGARSFDLDLERHHTDLFAVHARELLHWNKTINLTRITDPSEVAIKHFVDSLAAAGHLIPGSTLLDIGSGSGFPGIPLKVVLPSVSVTLIDASRKRVSFLKHVIRTLKLSDIEACHIRVEDLAMEPGHFERFGFIVSRALTDLKSFVSQASSLLKGDGVIIAFKGQVEQRKLKMLNAKGLNIGADGGASQQQYLITHQRYSLSGLGSKRSIVFIRKSESPMF